MGCEGIGEMSVQPNKHSLCKKCGHYYMLHDIASNECLACDDPTIPLIQKCDGFVLGEETKR